MFKRTMALLAVAVLLLSVFAACGNDPVTSNDSSATDSTPDTSSSVSDVSDAPANDENSDNSDATTSSGNTAGDKVTNKSSKTTKKDTAIKGASSIPLSKPITFSLFLSEHSSQPIKTDAMKWKALAKKTNVTLDVDIGTGSAANTKLSAAAASGTMYDITRISYSKLTTLKPTLFLDLTKRINKTETPNYYSLIKDDMADMSVLHINNKILGFSMYVTSTFENGKWGPYETSPCCQGIRLDILENNNIKAPTTWDEWFNAMMKLKAKYPNSTPYAARYGTYILEYMTNALVGMPYNIHYNSKTKKYECGVLDADFSKALQFMKNCYDNGILDKNFMSSSPATFQELAASNNCFFYIDNPVCAVAAEEILQETDPDACFAFIPLMSSKYNDNKKSGMGWTQMTNYTDMFCLSAKTAHPDELVAFMDWCYSEEGMMVNNCGLEGETYEYNKDGSPYFPEKTWKKFEDLSMPEYALMSEYGFGQLCFSPRVLSTHMIEWKNREMDEHEEQDHSVIYAADLKAGNFTTILDSLMPDVDSTIQKRYSNVNVFLRNQVAGFITGQRSMSEFNTFLADLKKMGINDILAACNK